MKLILIPIFLILFISAYGQTDRRKSTWSQDLPERKDTPKLDSDLKSDLVIDRGDFDRSSMFDFDEDEDIDEEDNQLTNRIQQAKILANKKRQAKKEQLLEKHLAEQAAEELLAEQAASEKLAEQERLTEQVATEKLLAEQVAAEKLATEKLLAEQAVAEELAAGKLLAEQTAAEELAAEKLLAEQVATEELAAEKLLAEQVATEELAQEKLLAVLTTVENPVAEKLLTEQQDGGLESASNTAAQEIQQQAKYTWKKIKNVTPVYPRKAAIAKKQGWVDVELILSPNGSVVDASVQKTSKNGKLFNRSSLKAVRAWKFEPPIDYGIEINQNKLVRLEFRL